MVSWIHVEDAAAAAALALHHDGPAIYNVVDDEPAAIRDWLPVLAQALGAKAPRHAPKWLELGWTPRYATWRTGFPATYSAAEIIDAVPSYDTVNRGSAGGTG